TRGPGDPNPSECRAHSACPAARRRLELAPLWRVVAVALLVTMQIGDVAGDQHPLGVEPGPGTDAVARIHARRVASLLLTEVGAPVASGVRAAQGLSLGLAQALSR